MFFLFLYYLSLALYNLLVAYLRSFYILFYLCLYNFSACSILCFVTLFLVVMFIFSFKFTFIFFSLCLVYTLNVLRGLALGQK
jgi:hypothetical protein